jgi:hypothetical protein
MSVSRAIPVVLIVVASGLSCADKSRSDLNGPSQLLTVERISPVSGPTAGATRVAIYGTSFRPGAVVTLNGVATEVVVEGERLIRATTPPGAAPGSVDVVVTNADGQSGRLSGGYTYVTPLPVVRELRISGPSSLAPGASGQFTAVAEYADGTSQDVTTTAIWRSSSPKLVFAAGGGARSEGNGEANVTAAMPQRISSPFNVLMLEPGTFRLSGSVRASGMPQFDGLVEVVAGTGAGEHAVAFPSYLIYGVAGNVEVRVTAHGFAAQTRVLQVSADTVSDFELQPPATGGGVAGHYTLTLTAAPACADRLQPSLRVRAFDLFVTHQGPDIVARFVSPTLPETDGVWQFFAAIEGTSLRIELPPFNGPLVETLWNGHLTLSGLIEVQITAAELRGTLNGRMTLYEGVGGRVVETAACADAGHAVVIRR